MLALTERGTLFALLGQRDGRPDYAAQGTDFACRSEPAWAHRFSGSAISQTADTRIFAAAAEHLEPRPGDRILLNGRKYRVAEVQSMRALFGIHHLEMLAKDEGAAEAR